MLKIRKNFYVIVIILIMFLCEFGYMNYKHLFNNSLISFNVYCVESIDKIFFCKAYAKDKDYEHIREENAHNLAQTSKMIYTTEPAICFAFAGLTKPQVVYETIKYLDAINAKGTFFVMEHEIMTNPQMVQSIIDSGNEVAIGLRLLKNSDFYSMCRQIDNVQKRLKEMGVDTNLVMQPWGKVTDETKEAVSAMGCKMISPTLNIVSSEQKSYTDAWKVVNERIGRYTYSFGRGWIIYYRLDFYDNDDLVIDIMDIIKRHKIDNIAYNSFYDDAQLNKLNDSSYQIKSIGEVLENKSETYDFELKNVNDDFVVNKNEEKQSLSFKDYLKERYIGNYEITEAKANGFTMEEKQYLDLSGTIHTEDKPVVFFTFDDWGTDASINHLLYVLRKHNTKATFFILTTNIMNNPNLLRAIAKDGHDIASHSEYHKQMNDEDFKTAYDAYIQDYSISYNKLNYLAGEAFKPYFRPPTLNISKAGFTALYDTGFEYIVSGSYSTHDYEQPDLKSMINSIKAGIYDNTGKVINGAVLVMHMSDSSVFTPIALDLLLEENEKRQDNDPAKFIPMALSEYLRNGYSQGK